MGIGGLQQVHNINDAKVLGTVKGALILMGSNARVSPPVEQ